MTLALFPLGPGSLVDARIDAIVEGREGPWPLSPDEKELLRMLKRSTSAEPIPMKRISERFDMTPRNVKATIKCFIENFGVPIGGSRQEPYGYYLIASGDEMEDALRPLLSELKSIGRRVRALGGLRCMTEAFDKARADLEAEK